MLIFAFMGVVILVLMNMVFRGTSVVLCCPVDGMEAISNPFVQQVQYFFYLF